MILYDVDSVLLIKVILTLNVNRRNWKILFMHSFPAFVSDLFYEFWQIPNLQEIISIYSVVKGRLGETYSQKIQPSNLWI